MVFEIKTEDFRCNGRVVARGHMTKPPIYIIYASVVSRDMVHIALMIITLNNFKVKVADILNAFIQAPVTEKV